MTEAAVLALNPAQRVDWPQLLVDLSAAGLTMEAISEAAAIPVSTLAGYKSLNVEPKHADGVRLIYVWQRRAAVPKAVPLTTGSVRNSPRTEARTTKPAFVTFKWPPRPEQKG
ncbi:MAG: hypothetical protein V4451_16985 [Pseudomonadota bacterium]